MGTKVAPWCKHCNCCGWWTRDEATLISKEIKAAAQAVLQLRLVEPSQSVGRLVGWSVSWSVSQLQKNASNLQLFDEIYSKTIFFVLAMPVQLSEWKYWAGF